MKNKKLEANLSMVVSRTMAGLNMNGLKYLLPVWIGALTGVTLRCVFAAVAFWVTGWFVKEAPATRRQRLGLLALGAFGIYGFMFCYLLGISKTTPISSAIFSSLQPIWVFIISVILLHERATLMKIIGISMGFGGALLCIVTQGSDDLASDAMTGNVLCFFSSLIFAVYLILSKKLLEEIGMVTVMKYVFTGAAISGVLVSTIMGWDAPLFADAWHGEWHLTPWLVLAFILIFPTFLSYFLMPIGLKYLKTTVVAMYGYLILVITTIVSYVIGQDRFSWTQAGAIGLICISVYFVELAEKK